MKADCAVATKERDALLTDFVVSVWDRSMKQSRLIIQYNPTFVASGEFIIYVYLLREGGEWS